MSKERRLHAIVFSWPRQGHTNPMLRFSELLAMQGCQVTFVHSELNLKRVKQAAAAPSSKGRKREDEDKEVKMRFVGIKDGLPEGHPRDMEALILSCTPDQMRDGLASSFEALVGSLLLLDCKDDATSPCTTFIVSDMFTTFTQDVANKFHIPRIAIFLQSAASFACHVAVSQGFRPLPGDKYLRCFQGALPSTMKTSEMISFLQCYDPTDLLYKFFIESFERISEPTCIVLNTFDELEHDAIDFLRKADTKAKHIHCSGPLLPLSFLKSSYTSSKFASESLREEDHQCLKWLDTHAASSVLFVSFGSLVTISARQAEEFAVGIESSMVPFLWVLRPGLIEDGGLPEGFAERVKERACFVTWAPQIRVLSHPAVGGFLTHCGWNSTTESVTAGVPMLGWSYFADQMLNCRCIADSWGLGLSLFDSNEEGETRGHGELVRRSQVERKVRALMSELPPSVKSNCARLKEAASRAAERRMSSLVIPLLDSLQQISSPMPM